MQGWKWGNGSFSSRCCILLPSRIQKVRNLLFRPHLHGFYTMPPVTGIPCSSFLHLVPKPLRATMTCIFTARNKDGARLCFYTCLWFCSQGGGWYPSMHCRWYPNMPCSRSPGSGIPAFLAGFQAHTQGGSLGVWPGGSPGPHPRGCLLQGGLLQEGCLLRGYLFRGGGDPPWWLLLRVVRIPLECILVHINLSLYQTTVNWPIRSHIISKIL